MWNLHQRNQPPNSAAIDTANLTVAFDIDPDDDTAMADDASRYFEPRVLS